MVNELQQKESSGDKNGVSYGVACEHHHSNLVLLAQKKFQDEKTGNWNTWIDYDRFHELVNGKKPFTAMDYVAPTPSWAMFGAKERGMDPQVQM